MFGSNNQNTESGSGKKKRLPVFSVSLVICYLVVSVLFFVYGFGEGRNPVVSVEPVTTPTVAPPVVTPEPVFEPVEDETIPLPPAVKVRGIWLGAWWATQEKIDSFIDLCETTEINTLVIDVKEEHGHITFLTDNELISGTARDLVPNIEELIEDLNNRGIYTIARLVCFKDPIRASRYPQYAIQDFQGNQWRDTRGTMWLSAYKRENWDYLAEIGLEAARLGFKEIQLDYVRFPVEGRLSDINHGQAGEEQTRAEVIAEFMGFMRDTMHQVGVRVSADIFAISGISERDAGFLGQDPRLLFPNLDAISPMIYPSHFSNEGTGAFGNGVGQVINGVLFTRPALEPHAVVYNTLQHFRQIMDSLDSDIAVMRPFLQNSNYSFLGEGFYMPYEAEEVLAQIQAVYDAGFDEWILWSDNSVYSEDAFR